MQRSAFLGCSFLNNFLCKQEGKGLVNNAGKGNYLIMKMAASGLMDPHPRVRYEALTSLGLLLTELAPEAQKKYHDQLITVILKMM